MMDSQRHLFDLDDDIYFLNGAYMSPQLLSVEKAGVEAIRKLSKPYLFSTQDFFDSVSKVKHSFARLIHSDQPERVAYIPSVSYGIATVANNIQLEPGDEIIVLKDQFPSNYYSWKSKANEAGANIIVVDGTDGETRGHDWTQKIVEAINPKTKVVAICQVHWAEGIIYDLSAIGKRSREVDAWFVIDGTQSVGALDFDVNEVQPDALICAAYKWLMGPYGSALAYYGPRMDSGRPIEENWINRKDSHLFQNLVNYQDEYSAGSGRYSVGEQSNFILLPMLSEALGQLIDWGTTNIQTYCRSLNEPYLDQLRDLGFQVLGNGQMAEHLLGIQIPDHINESELKQSYSDHQVVVSFRGPKIRISPNVYNRKADWERLIMATKVVSNNK